MSDLTDEGVIRIGRRSHEVHASRFEINHEGRVLRNQPAHGPQVPPQDGVWRLQRRYRTQALSSEAVTVHGESTSLSIGQPQAPPAQVLPQVLDDLKLVAIHLARKGHEQDPRRDGVEHGPSLSVWASTSPT
jgi:type VI protein secretion system component VasF